MHAVTILFVFGRCCFISLLFRLLFLRALFSYSYLVVLCSVPECTLLNGRAASTCCSAVSLKCVPNQICMQTLFLCTGKCVLILIAQNERSMKNDQQNICNSLSIHRNSALFFLLCSFFSSAHFFLFPLLLTFSSLQFAHFFSLLPFTRVTFRRAYDSHFIFFLFVLMPAQKWVQFWLSIIDHWNFFASKRMCVCQKWRTKWKKKTEFLSKCESESAFNWLRLKLVMFYCCSSCALALIGHLRLCMFGYIINWRIKLANDLQFHANVSMKFNWLN